MTAPTFSVTMAPSVSKATKPGSWSLGIEAGGRPDNPAIAGMQAALGRNPWYLSPGATQTVGEKLKAAFAADVRRQVGALLGSKPDPAAAARNEAALTRSLRKIADDVLRAVLGNVRAQRNRDGSPFAALTEGYAAYKRRKYGFKVPILKATNDLLGGLRARVDRL